MPLDRLEFPVGRFLSAEPRVLEVDYSLPYNQAVSFANVQDAHIHDLRGDFVQDRSLAGVREKGVRRINIWIFQTTFPSVSRRQFNSLCGNPDFGINKRPITFIELLAFARQWSMMDEFAVEEGQSVTNALGSVFKHQHEGNTMNTSVSYCELADSRRESGPRKDLGLALCDDGFGDGVFLPVTDRD